MTLLQAKKGRPVRILEIPDVFVAGFLQYKKEELFQVTEVEKQDVKIDIKLPQF